MPKIDRMFSTQKEYVIHYILINRAIRRNFALSSHISRLSDIIYKINSDIEEDKEKDSFERERIPNKTPWGKIGYDFEYRIKDSYYAELFRTYNGILTKEDKDIIFAYESLKHDEQREP